MFFNKKKENNRKNNSRVYMDYAAATPLRDAVYQAMEPYWSGNFANSGAAHTEGVTAKNNLQNMRASVQQILNAQKQSEIIFTSGGTESNSLAIRGIVEHFLSENPGHSFSIITSRIEHPSVTDAIRYFKNMGGNVLLVNSNLDGTIDLQHLGQLLTESNHVLLVSIMMVNNEIGTVQPVRKIGKLLSQHKQNTGKKIYFHTDASQAPLFQKTDAQSLDVDLLTLCGQKLYGPKGSGALYVRDGTPLQRQMLGGKQEFGLRGGTAPMPLIAGFTKSLEMAESARDDYVQKMNELKNYFLDQVLQIPGVQLNGDRELVLPLAINLSLENSDRDSEQLVIYFDTQGFAVSSKSACIGSDIKNSTVVESLGVVRKNSVRFSFGDRITKKDIDRLVTLIKEA